MDRWDWIWLNLITQLAICEKVSHAECDAAWESYNGRWDTTYAALA